jgi:hypothetical protein
LEAGTATGMAYNAVFILWYDARKPKYWSRSRRPLLGNGSVNTFPRRQNNVTTPLLRQQILGKKTVVGRHKHTPVETVFSMDPPRGYIMRISGIWEKKRLLITEDVAWGLLPQGLSWKKRSLVVSLMGLDAKTNWLVVNR